jgi:hypothetical protein
MYRTGFFGSPARTTKTHVVQDHPLVEGWHPICGNKIAIDLDFKWCANYIHLEYVECKTCLKKAGKILKEKADADQKLVQRKTG